MSYCRFSSMDFGCDVYAYADIGGGVTVHVAAVRVVGEVPPTSWSEGPEVLVAQHRAQMAFLEKAERRPIGLSRDGQSYWNLSFEAAVELLRSLKAEGYRIPPGSIEAVEEDRDDAARIDTAAAGGGVST